MRRAEGPAKLFFLTEVALDENLEVGVDLGLSAGRWKEN